MENSENIQDSQVVVRAGACILGFEDDGQPFFSESGKLVVSLFVESTKKDAPLPCSGTGFVSTKNPIYE